MVDDESKILPIVRGLDRGLQKLGRALLSIGCRFKRELRVILLILIFSFLWQQFTDYGLNTDPEFGAEYLMKWDSQLGMVKAENPAKLDSGTLIGENKGNDSLKCQRVKLISWNPMTLEYTIEILAPLPLLRLEDKDDLVYHPEHNLEGPRVMISADDFARIFVVKDIIFRNLNDDSPLFKIPVFILQEGMPTRRYKDIVCSDKEIRNGALVKVFKEKQHYTYRIEQTYPDNVFVRLITSVFREFPTLSYIIPAAFAFMLDYVLY